MLRNKLQAIENIISKAIKKNVLDAKSLSSFKWFRGKTQESVGNQTPEDFVRDSTRMTKEPLFGEMYHFYYEPKTAKTLPYYDKFPLVIPINEFRGGFLGLNLHYLNPKMRAAFFDVLSDFIIYDGINDVCLIAAKYHMLKSVNRYKYFKPCLKRYLYSHIRSNLIKIHSTEWDKVIFLPTERFMKENLTTIWQDSRDKIYGN